MMMPNLEKVVLSSGIPTAVDTIRRKVGLGYANALVLIGLGLLTPDDLTLTDGIVDASRQAGVDDTGIAQLEKFIASRKGDEGAKVAPETVEP